MTMHDYLAKYGTESTSRMLMFLGTKLRDRGSDIDLAIVKEMADDLSQALYSHIKANA